jgi:energy-coupling factor transport system permease protein
MRLTEPVADPGAPLARRNPVAKLAAAFALSFGLVATLDPVAPAIALAAELLVVPLFGVRYGTLFRRGWPVLISAAGMGLAQLLFGTGPVGALALGLRVLAVALVSVLAFASIDPTELADALVQHVRVPARFAIGALAAFRLLPLLAQEWELLVLARRARGIEAGRNPVVRLRLFASTMFALLVGAIRRGTRLATAMDARGFGGGSRRSMARRSRFTAADAALICGGLALTALALGVSIATGAFRALL